MIIVTGGAGFIGSAFVKKLNDEGHTDITIVDRLGKSEKWKNLINLRFEEYVDVDDFEKEISESLAQRFQNRVQCVFHFGACSDTMNYDASYMMKNNFNFSKLLYTWTERFSIRLIYASSAATYGLSETFSDKLELLPNYTPLNIYGYSKHLFDLFMSNKFNEKMKNDVGIKFFNVFGPNEYHKGEMSSMVYKLYNEFCDYGEAQIFKDGEQKRDFIYIKDVVEVIYYIYKNNTISGIFNLGTGVARTFKDLTLIIKKEIDDKTASIKLIDMPENIKSTYQEYTQADMSKLRGSGYYKEFMTLEDSIKDYIQSYLINGKHF